MDTTEIAIRQAELIMKLYELRRETVMREARSYVGGEFLPSSAQELIELVSAGGKFTGFVLQVYGYWDMVAGFVLNGALTEKLVYETCQEMYFQYAKIQPYVAGVSGEDEPAGVDGESGTGGRGLGGWAGSAGYDAKESGGYGRG